MTIATVKVWSVGTSQAGAKTGSAAAGEATGDAPGVACRAAAPEARRPTRLATTASAASTETDPQRLLRAPAIMGSSSLRARAVAPRAHRGVPSAGDAARMRRDKGDRSTPPTRYLPARRTPGYATS